MKKHFKLIIIVFSFLLGFFVAYFQTGSKKNNSTTYSYNNILPSDRITLIDKGNVYSLTDTSINQITHSQNLIEPALLGRNIVAINKTTNYSSLLMFDINGNLLKTIFDGNSNKIDTMSWITDPAINHEQNRIAYVSDKDKAQTNIPDSALYVLNLTTGKSTNIANPAPYSGGITRPIFDPVDGNIILYDYYQYDPQTSLPYSTIQQFNNKTGLITTLTFENKNAYQESPSFDGKQLIFLGRNENLNTVTLYIADFDLNNGISNIHSLLTGDIAYPIFSKTKNHIYFLNSENSRGYNLLTGTIQNNKLVNIQTIVGGFQLLGNSSYSVN